MEAFESFVAVAISEQGTSEGEKAASRPSVGDPLPQLEVQDVVAGGWHTLRLVGEVDLAASILLDEVIERVCAIAVDGIVLDLSEVSFIDSTGVRAVLVLHERCKEQGTELRISSGSKVVQRVFEIAGLLDRLPFVPVGSTDQGSDPNAGT